MNQLKGVIMIDDSSIPISEPEDSKITSGGGATNETLICTGLSHVSHRLVPCCELFCIHSVVDLNGDRPLDMYILCDRE